MPKLGSSARVVLLALSMLGAGFAAGEARAADWVVNINDTGFDPIPAGGTVVYTITVENEDLPTASAPANTIAISIPATARFEGGSDGDGITGCTPLPATGPATVTCSIPALQGGNTATLRARVVATMPGTITVAAAVPTLGIDREPLNNAVSQSTTVTQGADIGLTLSGPATAASGSVAGYSYTATNLGPFVASGVVVNVPVPQGLSGIVAPPGCSLSAGNYTCTIPGPLAVGASASLNFSGQISVAASSTVTVSGSVTGSTPPDPNPANNTATFNTAVTAGSDVRITKSRAPAGTPVVGDRVTFTLGASYTGDAPFNLTIRDSIPAAYGIVSVTPSAGSGWSCTVTGQLVECTRPAGGGAGANIPLGSITIEADVASAGPARNTATIAAEGPPDPDLSNNSASDTQAAIEDPKADLAALKTGPTSVVQGQSYSFTISTVNLGNRPFTGTVVMTDSLPAGLRVTAYALNGWACTPAPPVEGAAAIRCERNYTEAAPLAVNSFTPSVTLTATVTAAGNITNSMTVSTLNPNWPDPNLVNNTASITSISTDPAAVADVSVVKRADLDVVGAGEVQTFRIELINNGPTTAADVSLTDNFNNLINNSIGPEGAGLVSVSPPADAASGLRCSLEGLGGATSKSGRMICTISSLPVCTAGVDCPVATVSIRPGGTAGLRINLASATSSTPDSNPNNNAGSDTYTVAARADVSVSKTVTPASPEAGQEFTYVVTAQTEPDGRSAAANVTIEDTLPEGLIFVSASPSTGSCTVTPAESSLTRSGNRTVLCNLGSIASGAQQTVEIVVRPGTATRGTTVSNLVAVSTTTAGDDPGNNGFTLDTPIQNPVLDLQVNKTDSPDPAGIGATMAYTVTITNNGPSAAENVVVTDTLPGSGLAYLSHEVPADGSCSLIPLERSLGGTLRCGFPLLLAGQSRVITIAMEGVSKDVVENAVQVSSDEVAQGFDVNPGNNQDRETTTVSTRVDLAVTKSPSSPTVAVDQPFTFTITLLNRQDGALTESENTQLTDTLPAGMVLTGAPTASFATGTASQNSCTGAAGGTSFLCNFGTVASGGLITITVPVRITAVQSLPQSFTNTASVATTSLDVDTTNNTASGTVTVNPAPAAQLGIDKVNTGHEDVDGSGTITQSDRLTYTITATNSGTATLTNVVVTDTRITPAAITCASLAPGATCVLTGSLTVTAADAEAGEIVNTATADSNETGPEEDSVTVAVVKPSGKTTLAKTAQVTTVKRGERVPYVILAQGVGFSPARIVDIMPPGFAYDEGSARANGVRVTPSVDGRTLTFDGLTPDKGAVKLELTLVATITAALGSNVNQAQLINPATGGVVASARARVTILEEAVFDCSDVIGKVFDDRNRNGYQDEGEPGLPGVRLATVRGLLVTTDPYGRFSIACADIPDADIGTNFIVKLDVRTLPSGYRVTTENPRRVRLTAGKVVKLNFGAAINRLVKLDLNDKVFEPQAATLKPKWQAGLDTLVSALGAEPSSLRITYVGENGKLARARLAFVTREIERRWKASGGGYRLPIETRIVPQAGKAAE